MPYCSSCGAPVHEDAKFCSSCGTATGVGASEAEQGGEIEPRSSSQPPIWPPPPGWKPDQEGQASPQSGGPWPPQVHVVRKRENPITGGLKMGATGCVGCVTFVAIALVVLIVLAQHH